MLESPVDELADAMDTQILGEHGAQLDSIVGMLGQLTVEVHAIHALLRRRNGEN